MWPPMSASEDRSHLQTLFKRIHAVIRKIPRGSVATYGQVAELAGVSIATVSRVLNGRADVSEETRQVVQQVAPDEPADTRVDYGITPGYGTASASDPISTARRSRQE